MIDVYNQSINQVFSFIYLPRVHKDNNNSEQTVGQDSKARQHEML